MNISIQFDIDYTKWSLFVSQHPYGNIFQTPEIYQVYRNTPKYEPIILSIVNEKDEILGILLSVIQKEHSGLLGCFSARSIAIGGPLVIDNNLEILDILLNEYKKLIKGRAIYSQFRNLWDWGNEEKNVFLKYGFTFDSHLDIIISLENSSDELWKNLSRDRKKSIKKGNSNLKTELIDYNEYFNKIYILLKNVYRRIGLPLPEKMLFYNAMFYLGNINAIKTFGAFKDNKLVGVRIELCYNNLIYDWYAGADDSFLEYRPNDVLLWNIFLWGKDNGFKYFDFGGAGKPNKPYGVRDYKLKFGGKLVNFGRFELVHKPIIYKFGIFALKNYKIIKKIL